MWGFGTDVGSLLSKAISQEGIVGWEGGALDARPDEQHERSEVNDFHHLSLMLICG